MASFARSLTLGRFAGGVAAALLVTAVASGEAVAKKPLNSPETVAQAELTREAQITLRAIRNGGPFPFRRDATVFANRERLLPLYGRGYYREYTVATPGAPDRGARRIVCGGFQAPAPDNCYYTGDHYASFQRIVP